MKKNADKRRMKGQEKDEIGNPNGTTMQEGRDRTHPIKFSIVFRGRWDFGAGRN